MSTGHALNPEVKSVLASFVEGFKKLYITRIKGFDLKNIAVATLLFEGTKEVGQALHMLVSVPVIHDIPWTL